ncbi:efflux RND transporter permease subunit [Tundrisphaera lichenicola]|uniref:efflux RND transporter permease subunit n=1 Tax=Tundrisphaera lichenicola TaxID=2029860 RepID=UPI003EBE697F
MISKFFIDRPIFASVLSIVITIAGGVALFNLPISLYPPISPPTVQVSCAYPGASAQVVAETVATPIEQQVNGVEGMMYMSSQCTNDGSYSLTVTFNHGIDLKMAQVMVQNRVSLAVPLLPDVIKQTGVTTRKRSPDILLAMAINSAEKKSDGSPLYDQLFLSNYALLHIKDELARVPGVSELGMLGQRDYCMRIWVDPDKLAARDMTATDVALAIRRQNAQVATGQIGQPPVPDGQSFQIPLSTTGRFSQPEEFAQIIVKKSADDRIVRLKDVAWIELGPKNQDIDCSVNGRPSVSLAVFQLPDANALETADLVKAKIEELAADFPPGLRYEIRYDTTPFIRESIGEVFKTLRDAVILVAVVVLLFLQNWRSALIPLVAVPVAIIGTFAVMAAMGFSLNNLTLFGLVLAIGIVVDDAIVVVEAVEHHVERGMQPRDATVRAMQEVSGPVIAIGLVLTAVFVPCAFITGIVGQFFRQFALTIATSTIISAFNSLTLSPALAAILIKPRSAGPRVALPRLFYALLGAYLAYLLLPIERLGHITGPGWLPITIVTVTGALAGWVIGWPADRVLVWFFGIFNEGFRLATRGYSHLVAVALKGSIAALLIYGGLIYLTHYIYVRTPAGFIPTQDMGYLLCDIQLADSTSQERSKAVVDRIQQIAGSTPGIKHTQAMTGQSMLLGANGSNFGTMFCILDSFEHRRTKDLYSESIIAGLRKEFARLVPEAKVTVLGPPPVRGIGRAGGFKLMVEDLGDNKSTILQGQTDNLIDKAKQVPKLATLVSTFRANVPQFFVDVNRAEAMSKEVALKDLFDTLRIYLGSLYVNDINLFGRTWQVVVQADSRFRNAIETVPRLKVRNAQGLMVPVGTLANFKHINGPLVLTRYNMHPAAAINGSAAPGVSSGDAIATMQALANDQLLKSMSTEWTELAYLELQAGNTAGIVFCFAVVMVFLVLAAQYESWSMPLAIILVVPMCLLSGVVGVNLAGEDINIFTQIGFVVLVGLASKNAILIVEFANQKRTQGESRLDSIMEACELRLRPIIMTSLAFILGVVPLLLGHGAGAEMRYTLGATVFSGMIGVTAFGIFLTPVFFYVIDWLGETRFFASPRVRRIAGIPLSILSLRFLRNRGVSRGRKAVEATPAPESVQDPVDSSVAVDDRVGELVEQE